MLSLIYFLLIGLAAGWLAEALGIQPPSFSVKA